MALANRLRKALHLETPVSSVGQACEHRTNIDIKVNDCSSAETTFGSSYDRPCISCRDKVRFAITNDGAGRAAFADEKNMVQLEQWRGGKKSSAPE